MILGTGTDIVRISRIAKLYSRYGDRFLEKFMSSEERALVPQKRADEFIAGRFAAKESLVKALGGRLFPAESVSIVPDENGRPHIPDTLSLQEILGVKGLRAHVSISHEGEYAIAMVVLESAD